jgi:hypothetical protein
MTLSPSVFGNHGAVFAKRVRAELESAGLKSVGAVKN